MKPISDIRIFSSKELNIDGNSHPPYIDNRIANIVVQRIAMKLREKNFSLGEFDHLYINFTNHPVPEGVAPSKRSIDTYHPWYRYYDFHVSEAVMEAIGSESFVELLYDYVYQVLIKYFTFSAEDAKLIDEAICAAKAGAHMRVLYKEKKAANTIAQIYLRIFDDGKYHPILQVKNLSGNILLEKELNPCSDLGSFGTVQVGNKRVKISPRKSDLYSKRKPIIFELK